MSAAAEVGQVRLSRRRRWRGPGLEIVLLITGFTLVGEGMNDTLNPLVRERPIDAPEIPEEELVELPPAGPAGAPAGATAATAREVNRE